MSIGDRVTRVYGGFRGVDFRGEEINLGRSPDSLNVWKDYKETESIRTRPGLAEVYRTSWQVYGIFFHDNVMFVHEGNSLHKFVDGVKKEETENGIPIIPIKVNPAASQGFFYENKFYFKDGKNYLVHDGEKLKKVEGYVPTTSIARKPAGGGTIHEDVNLLTGRRINTFLADGTSKDFYLDAKNIDTDFRPVIKVNGTAPNGVTVDYAAGKVTFDTAPAAPKTDGQDNVSIEFSKTIAGAAEKILNCTLLQVFDNRVFFSGNKNYPNMVWHCSLNDPSYCSDLDYYREGVDNAQITGLVAGNNALWVFREPSDANTSVFYHTPTLDADYGKIYPSTHSSIAIGCVGEAINFNDDIVFFSERGMEGVSGDVTTEQAVAHRSSLVDRRLLKESGYRSMVLEEWEGYLCIFCGNKVYLADSRTAFNNEGHLEYEFFYWELDHHVTCAKVHNGVLYLGTRDGVYTLTDTQCDVESYWVTPKDKFKHPQMQKTTNKRGCVAEATGDIDLYAKTDKTEFELIGSYKNVTDAFVSRIKRKKFKDIQLKFHSKTRFSLETVTLECFVGGYIKR